MPADPFLRVIDHPLMGRHLAVLRARATTREHFRAATAEAACYESLPAGIAEGTAFVLDPMPATGGSAVAALRRVREAGARDVRLVCLVAAPEGLAAVRDAEPTLPIVAGAVDRGLDERGFIRPGPGDAGDRIFGTV